MVGRWHWVMSVPGRLTNLSPLTRICRNRKSCEFSYDSDTTLSEIFPNALRNNSKLL